MRIDRIIAYLTFGDQFYATVCLTGKKEIDNDDLFKYCPQQEGDKENAEENQNEALDHGEGGEADHILWNSNIPAVKRIVAKLFSQIVKSV